MPKCASTWLQRHLFIARNGYGKALATKPAHFALIYPDSFCISDWGEARSMFDFDLGDKVPVVSLEVLVGNPLTGGENGEGNLHRLSRVAPEARILLVIREQQAMLRSIYKTLVNFGSPLSIETLLNNDLTGTVPAFALSYLYYDRIIAAYRHVFGEDAVLVLPMELLQEDPDAFVQSINAFSGIDSERYPPHANPNVRENVNRTLLDLEVKRQYNRFIARTRLSPGGFHKPTMFGNSGNIHIPAPAAVHRAMERRFADKVAAMTAGHYAQSNAATCELTGLDLARWGYALPADDVPQSAPDLIEP